MSEPVKQRMMVRGARCAVLVSRCSRCVLEALIARRGTAGSYETVWGRRREAGTARVGMGARGVTRRASAHRCFTADAVHSGYYEKYQLQLV